MKLKDLIKMSKIDLQFLCSVSTIKLNEKCISKNLQLLQLGQGNEKENEVLKSLKSIEIEICFVQESPDLGQCILFQPIKTNHPF